MGQLPDSIRTLETVDWITETEREAIARFKRGLAILSDAGVQRVILFGSRARGEGNEDSDLDLAVILSGDERSHWRQIVDLATELNLEYGYRLRISPLTVSQTKLLDLWERERAIAHAILVEGIQV
jgi:predicted nucleotidyltransferase